MYSISIFYTAIYFCFVLLAASGLVCDVSRFWFGFSVSRHRCCRLALVALLRMEIVW